MNNPDQKNKEYSIGIIMPYFGNPPNYFNFFLKSIERNNSIDFMLFTDNKKLTPASNNLKVIECSFREFREKIQNNFDFKISCESPYKLCDFRPSYGKIFKDELANYDFWGHCDVDLIFGNIRNFVPDSILSNFDKMFSNGHFTLYKNEPFLNALHTTTIKGMINYQQVYSSNANFCFDESSVLSEIWKSKRVYINKHAVADVNERFKNFRIAEDDKALPQVFDWNNGTLTRFSHRNGNNFEIKEFMYIHLQGRNMQINHLESIRDQFYIIPDRFISPTKLDVKVIKKLGWRITVFPFRIQFIKKKILRWWKKILVEIFNKPTQGYFFPSSKFFGKEFGS